MACVSYLYIYIYTSWFTSCRHVCNGMSSGYIDDDDDGGGGVGGEEEEEE